MLFQDNEFSIITNCFFKNIFNIDNDAETATPPIPPPLGDYRITADGSQRITANGDIRVPASPPEPVWAGRETGSGDIRVTVDGSERITNISN